MYNYYRITESCKQILLKYEIFIEKEKEYSEIDVSTLSDEEKLIKYNETIKSKQKLDNVINEFYYSFDSWMKL